MKGSRVFLLALAALLLAGFQASAQVFSTQAGRVHFFSDAALEDIEATSTQAECALAPATGQLSARIAMSSFVFERKLMQRHFNENYLETEKYPFAKLEGKLAQPIPTADGTHPVQLLGRMTLHGVTKDYTVPGLVEMKDGLPVHARARFQIRLADHEIKIPFLARKSISEVVDVDVDFPLQPKGQASASK